jgi:hypothetical protein
MDEAVDRSGIQQGGEGERRKRAADSLCERVAQRTSIHEPAAIMSAPLIHAP